MKSKFDKAASDCSKLVTQSYSTSFSLATKMLHPSIRKHIYNIYGFVRFADEIVDSFHDYPKEELLKRFESDLKHALKVKISLNPIINSFQHTVRKFNIEYDLIQAFLKSMFWDLNKKEYCSETDLKEYIYGSADVVGLMCLKVFTKGDKKAYDKLKPAAMALGSALQKVNFLRDFKQDYEVLNRTYFPGVNFSNFDEVSKNKIVKNIESELRTARKGILKLSLEARLGVYVAYRYYEKLLKKLKRTPAPKIKDRRIRINNFQKMRIFLKSYFQFRFNIM